MILPALSSALSQVLALDALPWLIATVVVAGLVRGFAGFGTALIYMPIATSLLPPIWALTTLAVIELIGPLPNLPKAWRTGSRRDVIILGIGAMVALPFGVFLLTRLPEDPFRWALSFISLALLALLVSGWRYRGTLTTPMIGGVGAIGGAMAGSTGLSGPPVILLYMASSHSPAVIRANLLLYLIIADFLMVVVFAASGLLQLVPLIAGFTLAPAYLLANIAGAAIFQPGREKLYRRIAYVVIAGSAIAGLPLWDLE